MIGKCCVAAVLLFAGTAAAQTSTTLDVPIVVTHGAPLTTFTFVNNSGKTLPAGSPVSFGQAFRYGDVMPGNHPVIRDAATHVPLAGQQWNEISTWRENGGNGSWRHAVWAIDLPNSLAAGATYQVEFAVAAGAYSQSPVLALSALCSGPNSHDLKIHLTDVRNQDDTVRRSGDATFDLCANIANTGRDAPRILDQGSVRTSAKILGRFLYTDATYDPLLYAECNVGLWVDPATGNSLKDTNWVCHVHNSWMNVKAGNTGNAGNIGPAGLTNDPQAISYRAEVDDGATDVLDWSNLDATISSATNPIVPQAGNCDDSQQVDNSCMFVASSTGANAWYYGQATRITCSATCVAGLTRGQLYYVYPASESLGSGETRYVSLTLTPQGSQAGAQPMTASQGTGTTTFSTRFQHYHWATWQTLDASGLTNWSPGGTAARVTRKIYPAFTSAEKLYWEETGLIAPILLSQTTNAVVSQQQHLGLGLNYEPFGRLNVIGGGAGGPRADIGITGEWAAQALVLGTESAWDAARLFTYGSPIHGYSTLLNETTGRIPPNNNGPPVGPGGNGIGTSYPQLGAPQNQPEWLPGAPLYALADVPHDLPNPSFDISGGVFSTGTGNDHMPSFDGFTYLVFGDRHFLDMMQWQGNRDLVSQRTGPGTDLGMGYYKDNNAKFTDGNTYHYWGLLIDCCQARGSAWMIRDVTYPAALGGDSNIERSYFNDLLTETRNYYPLWLKFKNGPGSTSVDTSIMFPDAVGVNNPGYFPQTFIASYVENAAWLMTAFLHEPLGSQWEAKFQQYYEGVCGSKMWGAPVSYYCIAYVFDPVIANGDSPNFVNDAGNIGSAINGVDAADFGGLYNNGLMNILSGGQVSQPVQIPLAVGDTVKTLLGSNRMPLIDQLPGNRWFSVMGPIDNAAGTFYLQCTAADHTAYPAQCPVANQQFTGFTRGGVAIVNEFNDTVKYRPSYNPGPPVDTYQDPNYVSYGSLDEYAGTILGYDMSAAINDLNTRLTGIQLAGYIYPNGYPSYWWDPTVVVPGLPAVVTYGNQFNNSIACGSAPGTVVSSLGLIKGNGGGPGAWSILPTSSDTTHFAISGNNLVTAGSLPCNASQAIQVQTTQTGGGTVTGQINLHIGP